MKLATFRHHNETSYGVVRADGIVDAGRRCRHLWPDLRGVFRAQACDELERLCADEPSDFPLDTVDWQPVIPDPAKILCIGLNYRDHAAELGRPVGEYPAVFTRFADTLVGHRAAIVQPRQSGKLDYEAELAVIIGRPCRHVAVAEAARCIAGYSIFNDVSVRDWQGHSGQYTPGKNFPATGPFGPWMVTAAAMGSLAGVRLRTRVNGTTLQDGSLDELIFSVPQIIAYLSAFTQLEPGDVIITGTPAGVGSMRKPPVWLNAGDVVEVEIDGIGTLSNDVIQEAEEE